MFPQSHAVRLCLLHSICVIEILKPGLGLAEVIDERVAPQSQIFDIIEIPDLQQADPCISGHEMLPARCYIVFVTPRVIYRLRVVGESQFFAAVISPIKSI